MHVRKSSSDTQVSEEGVGGGAPGTREDSPAAHGEAAMPQQPMEIPGVQTDLQSLEEPTMEGVDA